MESILDFDVMKFRDFFCGLFPNQSCSGQLYNSLVELFTLRFAYHTIKQKIIPDTPGAAYMEIKFDEQEFIKCSLICILAEHFSVEDDDRIYFINHVLSML